MKDIYDINPQTASLFRGGFVTQATTKAFKGLQAHVSNQAMSCVFFIFSC